MNFGQDIGLMSEAARRDFDHVIDMELVHLGLMLHRQHHLIAHQHQHQ
jgi:hypothetical protein